MGVINNKKFELNIKALENFDNIMSTKLDEVEELKITGLDSKLLNIVSLCANIKTLIIEGDQRINCDKILSNIFKPELLENLILNNVKIPSKNSLDKYSGLKMISLNDIRYCDINGFFEGIINPNKIEVINITNTDMSNGSIKVINQFNNLKYLKLENLKNCKFDNLEILRKNENILKIDITQNAIKISELDNIFKCKAIKNIDVDIVNNNFEKVEGCRLTINKDNCPEISFKIDDFEFISKEVKLYKVSKLNLNIDKKQDNIDCLKKIKKLRKDITVTISNIACVTIDQVQKMKESWKLSKINLLEDNIIKIYELDDYINVRSQIDIITSEVSKHVSEAEKFLEIYKVLGNELKISEDGKEISLEDNKFDFIEVAQFLQYCLQCMNIKSNIIIGDDIDNERKHSWNQVELDKKWYNVDLALDIQNIKNKRVEYCLLGDENFIETHTPKGGKNNYCAEDYNQKLLYVFFKTGLFKENILQSYIQVIVEKLKEIVKVNKLKNIALPSSNNEKDE